MRPALISAVCIVGLVIGLSVIGPAHAQTYRVYIQTMPHQWQAQFGDVLSQSVTYWEKSIPGLKFEPVLYSDNSDFVVEWDSKNAGDKLGYYSTNTLNHYGKPVVGITLVYLDGGKMQMIPSDTVLGVAKHELGHAIGISHNANIQDVMYPTVDDFESLDAGNTGTIGGSADWHATSTKYQKMAEDELTPLQSRLDSTNASVNATAKPGDNSHMAYWWAVKYLDMAEKAQTDAGSSVLAGDYQNASQQFKAALDLAKKAEDKIAIIEESLK